MPSISGTTSISEASGVFYQRPVIFGGAVPDKAFNGRSATFDLDISETVLGDGFPPTIAKSRSRSLSPLPFLDVKEPSTYMRLSDAFAVMLFSRTGT
jgi:hypothetical protein